MVVLLHCVNMLLDEGIFERKVGEFRWPGKETRDAIDLSSRPWIAR